MDQDFGDLFNTIRLLCTEEFVGKHFEETNALVRTIETTIDKVKTKQEQDALCQELILYENETEDERSERAYNREEWIESFQKSDEDIVEYSEHCCNIDTCWYRGNLDRLEGVVIYRLKGTKNLFICDTCIDNNKKIEKALENH